MRVVLDTNILVSALISPSGHPADIYSAWEDGKFTLLTCAQHLNEVRATLQKPRVAELIKPHHAGRLVNQVKKLAEEVGSLPRVKRSSDTNDDFLLAMAEAGHAAGSSYGRRARRVLHAGPAGYACGSHGVVAL